MATHIWVVTHALRNAGLTWRIILFRIRNDVVDIFWYCLEFLFCYKALANHIWVATHAVRNAGLTWWIIFLESETMTLIFFDIVWDFFSGGSIIKYFWIIADFTVDEKYFWASQH